MFRSLKSKFFFLSLFFLSLTLIIVSFVSYKLFENSLLKEREFANINYGKAIYKNISLLFRSALVHSSFLITDPKIKSIMAEILNTGSSYEKKHTIDALEKEIRHRLVIFRKDMIGISILSEQHRFVWQDNLSYSYKQIVSDSLYGQISQAPNRFFLLKSRETDSPLLRDLVRTGMYFIGLTKQDDKQWIVLLKVNPQLAHFGKRFRVLIHDSSGSLIWTNMISPHEEIVDSTAERKFDQDSERLRYVRFQDKSILFIDSPLNDWRYTFIFDEEETKKNIGFIRICIILSAVVFFMVFSLISLMLCDSFVRPLKRLIERIRKTEGFDSETEVHHRHFIKGLKFKKLSLKKKLILFFSFITMLPACLTVFITYLYTQNLLMRQVEKSVFEIMQQSASNTELAIDNLERSSAFLALHNVIQKNKMNEPDRGLLYHEINDVIVRNRFISEGVYYIDIYDKFLNKIYSNLPESFYYELGSQNSERVALESVLGKKWIFTRIDPRFNEYLISLTTQVRSQENISVIGYIKFGIQEASLSERFKHIQQDSDSQIFLINNEGRIISAENKEIIGLLLEDMLIKIDFPDRNQKGVATIKGKRYFLFRYPIIRYSWHLVFLIPRDAIMSDFSSILGLNAAAMLVVFLLMLTVINIISNRLVRPLVMLKNSMKEIQLGHMDTDWTYSSKDELGELSVSFKDMLQRLNRLLDEVYIHELREKEAQLQCLQYQINPHFLYNTFTSIKFLIKMGELEEASRMVTAVGVLFKKAAHEQQIIPMRDAIDYLRAYITISKMRYHEKLKVEWDLEEEIFRYKSLKFILQPLVENAIYHGIALKEKPGLVMIVGKIREERIIFEIIDDGPGMDAQKLGEVNAQIRGNEEAQGVGLRNVNERIRLYFGEEYGLHIESDPGRQTCVSVTVPAIPES